MTYFRALRPLQWTKNLVVFGAPLAAGVLNDPSAWPPLVMTVLAFCMMASAGYLINDVHDREEDECHPAKQHRPVASGEISVARAISVAVILGGVAVALAVATGRTAVVGVVAVYGCTTLLYTLVFRAIVGADLIVVASGFVLRAYAGAFAANVEVSLTFLLFILCGSVYVLAGKRLGEATELEMLEISGRPTLAAYSVDVLRLVMRGALVASILAYVIWAVTKSFGNGSNFFILTVVMVVGALLRYHSLAKGGLGSAPEKLFASDRLLQLFGIVWLMIFTLAVYR